MPSTTLNTREIFADMKIPEMSEETRLSLRQRAEQLVQRVEQAKKLQTARQRSLRKSRR